MILTECFDVAIIIIDDVFEEEQTGVEQFVTVENNKDIVVSVSAFNTETYKEVDLD